MPTTPRSWRPCCWAERKTARLGRAVRSAHAENRFPAAACPGSSSNFHLQSWRQPPLFRRARRQTPVPQPFEQTPTPTRTLRVGVAAFSASHAASGPSLPARRKVRSAPNARQPKDWAAHASNDRETAGRHAVPASLGPGAKPAFRASPRQKRAATPSGGRLAVNSALPPQKRSGARRQKAQAGDKEGGIAGADRSPPARPSRLPGARLRRVVRAGDKRRLSPAPRQSSRCRRNRAPFPRLAAGVRRLPIPPQASLAGRRCRRAFPVSPARRRSLRRGRPPARPRSGFAG